MPRLFPIATAVLAALSAAVGPARAAPVEPIAQFAATPVQEYRIGAFDRLNISVFQVPDLTFEKLQVDAAGNIQLPVIGVVPAAGRTTQELSVELARRLSESYLQNPQVTVIVAEAASQKVTVDGAVVQPGVYQMMGRTTLLQAVAMAKGPHRSANLSRVAVFRQVEGRRMVAVYDLKAIRRGRAEDPQILGDDVVVVDSSAVNTTIREVLGAMPAFAIFRPY